MCGQMIPLSWQYTSFSNLKHCGIPQQHNSNTLEISSLTPDPHCEARLYCIKFVNTKVYSNIFNCACSCTLYLLLTPAQIHANLNERGFYFHYRDQQNRKYFVLWHFPLANHQGVNKLVDIKAPDT